MKKVFATEEYYHVYNRGVDKREVFLDENDFLRFLKSLKEFNCSIPIGSLYEKSQLEKKCGSSTPTEIEPMVELVAFCLNENHYHLILKQLTEKGIEKFMQKVGTGYTNYFNKKYKRSGALFQGRFKAAHIDSNEYLLYISAYVNCNHFIHRGSSTPTEDMLKWRYSSISEYAGKSSLGLCNKNAVLGQFENDKRAYEDFLIKNALHMRNKKDLEKYVLE